MENDVFFCVICYVVAAIQGQTASMSAKMFLFAKITQRK